MSIQKTLPIPNWTAVVAMTADGVIGRDGDMPWRLSSDLRRFKKLTMGGTLIMGRRTYDSIGRPLPGRRTIVVSRNENWAADGVDLATTPEKAIEMAGGSKTFVVGGAEIYRLLIPYCYEICLTRVLADLAGDTVLDLNLTPFKEVEITSVVAGDKDEYPTEFVRLIRQSVPSP